MQKQTVSAPPDAVCTILREIDAARLELAVATPERQRLTMTAWIAQARAAQTRGLADNYVRQVAYTLQELAQTWWPGNVLALARTTPPQRVFPERSAVSLRTWDAVALEARVRLERAANWADDGACTPRPYAPAAMFAAICVTLEGFPGSVAGPSLDAVREAPARIAELRRIAAELRWLRGCIAPLPWAAAIGRLRAMVRALGQGGAAIAALLDARFTPCSWAQHLGRDPQRESVLDSIPGPDSDTEAVLAWLLRAFDVFDNPTLLPLCQPFGPQTLALPSELATRRHRRRLTALQNRLVVVDTPADGPMPTAEVARPVSADASRVEQARARFAGRRALFISNRSFPELEARLHEEIGLDCEAIGAVDAPRRRQALVQRIRGGAYDLVLVAHGFSGHADTEQFAEACRAAGILYCAVGKGRFTQVVSCLIAARLPRGFVASAARSPVLAYPACEIRQAFA